MMTQQEFMNLPEVKSTYDIERSNPRGSIESRQAWQLRKQLLAQHVSEEFAKEFMPKYDPMEK